MSVYSSAITTAEDLIAKFGQAVTWKQPRATVALPDLAKPWKPAPAEAADVETYTVDVAFFPVGSKLGKRGSIYEDGDVPKSSFYGLMAGSVDFSPTLQDVIVRDGKTYAITKIDVMGPSGEAVYYTVFFA